VPGHIIVAKQAEDALKILERVLVSFQESLLGGAAIRAMECATLAMLRIENTCSGVGSPANRPSLVPIDLSLMTWPMALGARISERTPSR
jgi:hypothetical protein